jgi:hypothetical protein
VTTPQSKHLDPATLLDYHERRLSAQEAEEVRAHVEACGVCRAELAMARSFAEVAPGETSAAGKERHRAALLERVGGEGRDASVPAEPPAVREGEAVPAPAARAATGERPAARKRADVADVRRHPAWGAWLPRGLLAAAVAFLAMAGWQWLHRVPTPEPGGATRAAPSENRWDMIVWDPTETAWPLEWSPVPGAASYVVRVQTEAGEVVAEVPASATGVELRFDAVPEERRGEALYAVAVAVGIDGPVISTRPRFLPRR